MTGDTGGKRSTANVKHMGRKSEVIQATQQLLEKADVYNDLSDVPEKAKPTITVLKKQGMLGKDKALKQSTPALPTKTLPPSNQKLFQTNVF